MRKRSLAPRQGFFSALAGLLRNAAPLPFAFLSLSVEGLLAGPCCPFPLPLAFCDLPGTAFVLGPGQAAGRLQALFCCFSAWRFFSSLKMSSSSISSPARAASFGASVLAAGVHAWRPAPGASAGCCVLGASWSCRARQASCRAWLLKVAGPHEELPREVRPGGVLRCSRFHIHAYTILEPCCMHMRYTRPQHTGACGHVQLSPTGGLGHVLKHSAQRPVGAENPIQRLV